MWDGSLACAPVGFTSSYLVLLWFSNALFLVATPSKPPAPSIRSQVLSTKSVYGRRCVSIVQFFTVGAHLH